MFEVGLPTNLNSLFFSEVEEARVCEDPQAHFPSVDFHFSPKKVTETSEKEIWFVSSWFEKYLINREEDRSVLLPHPDFIHPNGTTDVKMRWGNDEDRDYKIELFGKGVAWMMLNASKVSEVNMYVHPNAPAPTESDKNRYFYADHSARVNYFGEMPSLNASWFFHRNRDLIQQKKFNDEEKAQAMEYGKEIYGENWILPEEVVGGEQVQFFFGSKEETVEAVTQLFQSFLEISMIPFEFETTLNSKVFRVLDSDKLMTHIAKVEGWLMFHRSGVDVLTSLLGKDGGQLAKSHWGVEDCGLLEISLH